MEQQREFIFATGIGNGITFLGVASETSTGFRVEMRTEARDVVAMSPGKIQTRYAVYCMLASWRDDKTPITVIGHGDPCACVVRCLTERHDGPDADVLTVDLARTQPAAVGLVDAAFAQLGMPELHQHLHLRPAGDPIQPGIRTRGAVTRIPASDVGQAGLRIELSATAKDSIVMRAWKREQVPLHVDGYDGRFAIASHVSLQTSVDAREDVLELVWVADRCEVCRTVIVGKSKTEWTEYTPEIGRMNTFYTCMSSLCSLEAGKRCYASSEHRDQRGHADVLPSVQRSPAGLPAWGKFKSFDESDAEYKARVTAGFGTAPWEHVHNVKACSSLAEIQEDFDDDSPQYRDARAAFDAANTVPASLKVGSALPFRAAVSKVMADLASSHVPVPMNGDGFALVRSRVAAQMHIADVRVDVRPVGCMIRVVLDELTAPQYMYMDWPEAPSVVAPATDVQHAIAFADATGANPGSKRYAESALYALSGVAFAAVVDRGNNSWMEVGSVAVVIDGGRSCDIHDVIYQTGPAGAVWLGQESIPGRYQHIRWFTSAQWMAYAMGKGTAGPGQLKMDTHGKDIRPGTAVFTETCGRCGVSPLFTDATRDAEAEAHNARCFAVGDYVRSTSLSDDNMWFEGTVIRARPIELTVERTCTGRVPCDFYVGQTVAPNSKLLRRVDKAATQYDATQLPIRTIHVSIGPSTSTNDPCVWRLDPLDVEYDEVTLRDLLAKDAAIRQDAPTNYKRSPLTQTQRTAVSAYHSAQLRERIAKAEVERKAREVSVVVGIDPEDL
jgi:hypothetical protein